MTPEIDLAKLTVAEKDALILSLLPLVGQLEAALARNAELEARLARLETGEHQDLWGARDGPQGRR